MVCVIFFETNVVGGYSVLGCRDALHSGTRQEEDAMLSDLSSSDEDAPQIKAGPPAIRRSMSKSKYVEGVHMYGLAARGWAQ